jgi:glycosyltransferase involved in cell wall biosynthesis
VVTDKRAGSPTAPNRRSLVDGDFELDIVIPAHNEEHRIDPTLLDYRLAFPDPGVRIKVALDDCQDATRSIVERHIIEDPRIELHLYPKLGKGGVIQETFHRCGGELIAFVDADGATPPAELARLVETARHADGAIASRRHPTSVIEGRRGLPRAAASTLFAWLVQRLFRLPYRDTQCGAKVLRRDVLDHLLPFLTARDFLFDVDLLLVAHRLGYRMVEVPTIWIDRPGSRVRLTRDSSRMAWSLLRLWVDHLLSPLESPHVIGGSLERGDCAA